MSICELHMCVFPHWKVLALACFEHLIQLFADAYAYVHFQLVSLASCFFHHLRPFRSHQYSYSRQHLMHSSVRNYVRLDNKYKLFQSQQQQEPEERGLTQLHVNNNNNQKNNNNNKKKKNDNNINKKENCQSPDKPLLNVKQQEQAYWKWCGVFIRRESDWCGVAGQSSVVCREDGRIIGTLAVAFQRTDWQPSSQAMIWTCALE